MSKSCDNCGKTDPVQCVSCRGFNHWKKYSKYDNSSANVSKWSTPYLKKQLASFDLLIQQSAYSIKDSFILEGIKYELEKRGYTIGSRLYAYK